MRPSRFAAPRAMRLFAAQQRPTGESGLFEGCTCLCRWVGDGGGWVINPEVKRRLANCHLKEVER